MKKEFKLLVVLVTLVALAGLLVASVPVGARTPVQTAIHPNKWFNSNPVIKQGAPETTWGFTLSNSRTGMQIVPLPRGTTFVILVDGHTRVGTVTLIPHGTQSVSWTLTKAQSYKAGRVGKHNVEVYFWSSPQYGPNHSQYLPSEYVGSYTVTK